MDIDLDTTALLLIDLQHDIVSVDGKFGSQGLGSMVEDAVAIPAAARALGASRDAGLRVVHVGVVVSEGQVLNTTAGLFAGIVALGALQPGSDGVNFVDEVAPQSGEFVVMKAAVSALAGTPNMATLSERATLAIITH